MIKINKKNVKEDCLYILALAIEAILLSIMGVSLVAQDYLAVVKYSIIWPAAFIVFAVLVVIYCYETYIIRPNYKRGSKPREFLIVNTAIILVTVLSCALYSYFSPYVMPIAAVSLLVAILLSQRLGIMCAIGMFAILISICPTTAYVVTNTFAVSQVGGLLVSLIAAVCMTFLVHEGYTRLKITWGAIFVGFAMFPLGVPIALLEPGYTVASVLAACVQCFVGNAIAVGFMTVVLPIYESLYRIWTDFKLAEVCSLDQPLLKELKEKAPGTFSHSLTVATLAENCAITLGLNPFMARACAMYHDIGKTKNPQFFVENQTNGYNPHDDLIIDVSVKMITEHPEEGAAILKAHHLPDTIIKAALEHHGDSTLMFFYLKAKGITEGDLKADEYRYENPRPSTKYSAIIMICDIAEATIRAKKPQTIGEIEDIIYGIIQAKILDSQFSDCDISLKDLHIIKDSICEALPSMLHERIDYNKALERR